MTAQASATRYGLPVAAVARIQATLAAFPAIEQATLDHQAIDQDD